MTRKLPTVADLQAAKGKGQKTMLRIFTLDEAAAAEAAGIDVVSLPIELVTHPEYRKVAPTLFSMTGITHLQAGTPDDYLRFACDAMNRGADAVYCSGSLKTVEYLAREYIPVVGHVGLVPSRATWTGGFRAVGKTADSAFALYHECKGYENAGAFAVEIEVVPDDVATEISRRMENCCCGLWVRVRGVTRNTCSRWTSSATTRTTCRAIPRSIATLPPNMTVCSRNGSRPLPSSGAMWRRARSPRKSMW